MKRTRSKAGKRTAALARKSSKKKVKTAKTPASRASRSKKNADTKAALLLENADLRQRLSEAEETLTAIRKGEVDALVVSGPQGDQVYALRGAEQPYRILVESMNEGALSLTETGSIINCNRAFAKIVGESCGKLIGALFKDLVSKKDRERFELFWNRALEAEAKTEIELDINHRTIPTYISLNTRLHEGACWVFAVVTDISEQKRTEAELEEYRLHLERMVDEKTNQVQAMNEELQTVNEELRTTNEELLTSNEELAAKTAEIEAIINSMSDAVIYCDTKQRILLVNPAIRAVFEYSQDELVGKSIGVLYADESGFERMKEERNKFILKKNHPAFEAQYRRKDGAVFVGETRVALVRGPRGVPIGFIGIYRDITDRKMAEEKLRESELRYRSLVEDSPDAIVIHDGWKYLFANRAAVSMLGATNTDDIVGRDVYSTIHPDYQNIVRELMDMISKQGVTSPLREIMMLRLDGSAFEAESTGTSVILDGTRVFQIVIHDISARKKAEREIQKLGRELEIYTAQLEDTNKELEAFVYSVSHDLRAPLRSISGFATILKEDYAEKFDAQGKDYVERVWSGSERMSQIIEDLLNLSRITRQEINRMDFDLGMLAESVIANIRRTSPRQSVEIVLPQGLRASVDPNLIRIAFENLFENAWKFSSKTENARIEFGTREQDGKTVFFIRDNGAGFDKTYADKLFKPFHRLHTDKEFPGTGIGLSIVKRIIRRHGGTIWAEGEVGKGAVFYFTLG